MCRLVYLPRAGVISGIKKGVSVAMGMGAGAVWRYLPSKDKTLLGVAGESMAFQPRRD